MEKVAGKDFRVAFPYLSMNSVMKAVKDLSLPQREQSFAENCEMVLRVRLSQEEAFRERMSGVDGLVLTEV